MAERQGTQKKSTKVPMTAEEKAARAALVTSSQLGLEAQTARVATQSKGAYKQRDLRSGGSELQRYNLGRFSDDPFPKLGGTTGGGGNPGGAPVAPRSKPKPKAKAKGRKPVRGASRGGRGGDRPGADLNRGTTKPRKPVTKPRATDFEARREEEARRQAEAKRKREMEAARRRNKAQARRNTGGGSRTGQFAE